MSSVSQIKPDSPELRRRRRSSRFALGLGLCAAIVGRAVGQEAAVAAPPPASLEPAGVDDVSAVLREVVDGVNYPCMAAVVVKGRQVIARGVAGVRNIGDPTPATIDDRFHLGSCTKAMTATLCAMLVEEGKLRWDSTIGELFPELGPTMKPGWADVTLHQLLTQVSGIGVDLHRDRLWETMWNHAGLPAEARLDLLTTIVTWDLTNPPGSKYTYSNTNFIIAGMMAERVTGVDYEQLITARIFEPLGMATAMFGPPGSPDVVDQPWGTSRQGVSIPPARTADNPPMLSPAGRAAMSLDDWAKFVSLHIEGERAATARLLRPETYVKLHTPVLNDYACGWGRPSRAWGGDRGYTLTHSGSNTTWFAVAWLAPDKGMAVLIATNTAREGVTKVCDKVAAKLISTYIAPAPTLPRDDQSAVPAGR